MRVELVYIQCNISDSQALFRCFVLIILRMASLDFLFLCFVRQQACLWSYLVLKYFANIKAFVLFLVKKGKHLVAMASSNSRRRNWILKHLCVCVCVCVCVFVCVCVWLFCYFKRIYEGLKLMVLCFLLNKNIVNVIENGKLQHVLRDKNLLLQHTFNPLEISWVYVF